MDNEKCKCLVTQHPSFDFDETIPNTFINEEYLAIEIAATQAKPTFVG